MVKLEEVVDEEFMREQEGPQDDDDWDTDSESETSSIASFTPDEETLYERIIALQDIIPASYRRSISSKASTTTGWLKSGLVYSGKALWVLSTSALLVGVPWALAYSEEQQLAEMEREAQMQQRASEFLTPGAQPGQPQGAKPAL